MDQKETGCLFCRVRDERDLDRENLVLWRGDGLFVMLNKFPYNTGHLMVSPDRHVNMLQNLEPAERQKLMEGVVLAERALVTAYSPEGINTGINVGECAGAGVVGHLHVHLVPRWTGDTSFMPVVGEVKVMPESLDDTFTRLAAVI